MTEDEDRLRELLRAPLPNAARAGERITFPSVHRPGRARHIATISTVVVTIVLISMVAALFRVTADRPRPDAGAAGSSARSTRHMPVRSIAALTRAVPCRLHQPLAGPAQLRQFRPTAALRCGHMVRGSGLTRDVTGGPFGALVAGLEQPDATPSGGPCATYYDGQPSLVLVDASGGYLRPRFPRDRCGHLRGTAAYAAYLELSWRPMSTAKR